MMAHAVLLVCMFFGLLGMAPFPLEAQHRRALVIGNAAYTTSPLRNPIHDATEMATLLRQLGFEVTFIRDVDKPTMERAVGDFTRGVPKGTAGLFYFSGHGAQIEGLNYLLPIGREFTQPTDVKYHAIAADWILGRMEDTGMEVKLVILDACRNNPFGRSWSKALDRGLAVMDAPNGSLIAYATSPKQTASDGVGDHSPYTARLLREMPIPGRPVELVFKAVRLGVQQETQGEQVPWESTSLSGDFYFVPTGAVTEATPPPPASPLTPPPSPPPTPESTKPKVVKLLGGGHILIPNLTFREIDVCPMTVDHCYLQRFHRSEPGGIISPNQKSLEVPAGTYKLGFGNLYIGDVEVKAGQTKEIQLGVISIPNLSSRQLEVCASTFKCGHRVPGGVGTISPKQKSLEVPAGTYTLTWGEQDLGTVTVEAGATVVLEQ